MARVSCGGVFLLVFCVLKKCDTKKVMQMEFSRCLGPMKGEIFC